ncbi:uncharacterized protein F54H12.2-like [Orussus abietinus]|uniref:uncharacterized protein F54H12.2-like n=1 Tax=Orussus abietinus TaxID=222816 RepID=UPI000C715E50|nr:uncharacterized protein F54H12.2-like [Orussus abietinus]
MAFLHAHSHECLKSELSLFSLPPTQTTIDNSQWVHYKPISSLSDDSPIEFDVPGHGDGYRDFAHTMLSARIALQPVNSDIEVKTLKDVENVGPINNLLHSMFNQMDVFFNQKLVSPSNNAYVYRAYIETLLNYGSDAKKSHLTSSLWYGNTAGKMNCVDGDNEGHKRRCALAGIGKPINLIGHLHCDVFNQDRFLINGVETRLHLMRSRDSFCLMDPTDSFKVQIVEATLLVRRVNVNPGILLSHERALAKTTAKYALTRVDVKVMSMHAGLAFNGDRKLNPFNFAQLQHQLSVSVCGQQQSCTRICRPSLTVPGRIFARGCEKANLLCNIMNREIVNLEESEECPAFKNLPQAGDQCVYHGIRKANKHFSCSLNNAKHIREWLVRKSTTSTTMSADTVLLLQEYERTPPELGNEGVDEPDGDGGCATS